MVLTGFTSQEVNIKAAALQSAVLKEAGAQTLAKRY
jgi:hypothetical protein